MFSDNHPSYGAGAEALNNFLRSAKDEKTQRFLANKGINFKWSPANSPHRGGLFEALIRVIKTSLKKAIGRRLLTYEEFRTTVRSVQGQANSRPLYAASPDPLDQGAITPGHLLLGRPIVKLPMMTAEEDEEYRPAPKKAAEEILEEQARRENNLDALEISRVAAISSTFSVSKLMCMFFFKQNWSVGGLHFLF